MILPICFTSQAEKLVSDDAEPKVCGSGLRVSPFTQFLPAASIVDGGTKKSLGRDYAKTPFLAKEDWASVERVSKWRTKEWKWVECNCSDSLFPFPYPLGNWLNCRIPCQSFTCHGIRIAFIVSCLDLQSLPMHVKEVHQSDRVFCSCSGKLTLLMKSQLF